MVSLARVLSSRGSDVLPAILLAPWTGSMMQNEQRFVTELSICMRKKIAPLCKGLVGTITILCLIVTVVLVFLGKEFSALGSCFFPVLLVLSRFFLR